MTGQKRVQRVLPALFVLAALAGCGTRRTYRADGQPWPIPGLIEAENFDEGTIRDPAYHDRGWGSEAPRSQRYRLSNVDIGVDPKLNLADVGWVEPGEWLEYTVAIRKSGSYRLVARVATPENGRSFQIALDGVNLTGDVPVPNTGCWGSDLKGGHCFGEARQAGVRLPAGIHRLRLLAGTGNYTIDWLRFEDEGEGLESKRLGEVENRKRAH